ncbi:MAG: FAD:protein FMN transferase [Gammaproteobacteria bacterium]|nr:FAD:protein FMN transferase [Gammaproteobacteria bacterium]MBL7000553.1 FAD:protein FMN transferase [Gammaproteobacteria bacterium]
MAGLATHAGADWYKQSLDVMGTRVNVELWHSDPRQAERCTDRVFAEMQRIDRLMSPYKENSEVSRINRLAATEAVKVSAELFSLLQKSIAFSELSNGAFDISFASVGYYYDYRKKQQPSAQTIQQQLPAINYKNLLLQQQTVRFAKPGMRIDLGGIAKGYAVDRSILLLQQCGIQQALVSAGGDSRILGDHQGRPWMIGIQHPRQEQQIALSIPLSDSAISTSGDYERYFLSGNERIHHIINPKTGTSAHTAWSASVMGPDATTTDALSTTLFILGPEQGLKLINALDEIEAVIIDANGVVHYSSGLIDPASPG